MTERLKQSVQGLTEGAAREIEGLDDADRRLLAYRLAESVVGDGDLDLLTRGAVRQWSEGGCDAYQYDDISIVADVGTGYETYPGLAELLDATGWPADDFPGWEG